MKGGREKVGDGGAHAVVGDPGAFQMPKRKRLKFPFGNPETKHLDVRDTEHEHNVREIPIAGGGLGCALWDGGLVLTRWIYGNGQVFHNKSVLELGCGVALAGIMAAHWASSVVVTDYIDDAVNNAAYNIQLNSYADFSSSDDDDDDRGHDRHGGTVKTLPIVSGAPYRRCIVDHMRACMLDWDALAFRNGLQTQHIVDVLERRRTEEGVADSFGPQAIPDPPIQQVDIIIGSELTYNLLSCATLAFVVDHYLRPDGVFYEVLSDDRDGVDVFIHEIEARGFVTHKRPAPKSLTGSYGTRKWSKQDDETYSLYTWFRAGVGGDRHVIMS